MRGIWPSFSALTNPVFGPCSPAIWNFLWLLGWISPLLPLSHRIGCFHVLKCAVPFRPSQPRPHLLLCNRLTLTQLSCHLFGKASLIVSDCVSFLLSTCPWYPAHGLTQDVHDLTVYLLTYSSGTIPEGTNTSFTVGSDHCLGAWSKAGAHKLLLLEMVEGGGWLDLDVHFV